jgi:hypothetical protein
MQPITTDFTVAASDIGVKNKKFLAYVGNTFTPASVVISAYNANNDLLAEKTIDNVRCYKNKKTLLTGSLFPTTAAGFSVVVNPAWDTTSPTTPIRF